MAERPSPVQDYVVPERVVATMADAGERKACLSVQDLLIRGYMSGMIFALGLEHSVVNMFVIPAGILFSDSITIGD